MSTEKIPRSTWLYNEQSIRLNTVLSAKLDTAVRKSDLGDIEENVLVVFTTVGNGILIPIIRGDKHADVLASLDEAINAYDHYQLQAKSK